MNKAINFTVMILAGIFVGWHWMDGNRSALMGWFAAWMLTATALLRNK